MAFPAVSSPVLTRSQFYALVETTDDKLELIDGVVWAMGTSRRRHSLLCNRISSGLSASVRAKGCDIHDGNFYVSVDKETGPCDYLPDVWIRCGAMDLDVLGASDAIVVIEVLSPSTMILDRGQKMRDYCLLPTLQQFVLVYSDEARVEVWSRSQTDVDDGYSEGIDDPAAKAYGLPGWTVTATTSLSGVVSIDALDAQPAMQDLYEDFGFG